MSTSIVPSQEVDAILKKAVRLLHSNLPTSAAELRIMMDEAIKVRFGAEKMLSSHLTQRLIEDEAIFPGRAATPPPQIPTDEVINLTYSPAKTISDSPDTIMDSDDAMSGLGLTMDDDSNLKVFCDLNCCVCGEMVFTANNRLIECSKCGTLYHQECHKPPITDEETDEDKEFNWQCDACINKPSTSKATDQALPNDEPIQLIKQAKISIDSSRSSTSSESSSTFYKPEVSIATPLTVAPSSNSRILNKSTATKIPTQKEERSTRSIVTPTINIISAPERHGPITKRSSHSNKSSSKSSASKHHESSGSSSKRKSK